MVIVSLHLYKLCHGDCFHCSDIVYVMVIVSITPMSDMSWWLFPLLQYQLCHSDCFLCSDIRYVMVIISIAPISAMTWWLMCVSLQRQLCHCDWCVSLQCQLCHGDWCVLHSSVSYVMVIDVCFTPMSAMSLWLMCVSLQCQLCHGDWCVLHPNVSYVIVIDACFTPEIGVLGEKTPHYRKSHTPVSSWSYNVVSRTPLFDLELTIEASRSCVYLFQYKI